MARFGKIWQIDVVKIWQDVARFDKGGHGKIWPDLTRGDMARFGKIWQHSVRFERGAMV